MSARQNKKRKGRNNVNNRERTVTTFTEDPTTSFLVPFSSEEPAGGSSNNLSANILSSPFSVASSSGQQNFNQLAQTFSMPYANYLPAQQQQQQFYQPFLPPGENDLEILENLKSIIKDGQHEFYRAVPQPAALASLYAGPVPQAQSQVPPHPEQLPQEYQSPRFAHESVADTRNFILAAGKPSQDNLAQSMNNVAEAKPISAGDTSANTLGADAADRKPSLDSEDKSQTTAQGPSADTKTESTGEYGTRQPADATVPNKTAPFDAGKDDLARDNSWDRRTLDDRKGRYDDRNGNLSQTRASAYDNRLPNGTATGPDSRLPPADDRRFHDRDWSRDRLVDRERDRDKDWDRDRLDTTRDLRDSRDWDRDRDLRDRRPDFFGRSFGRTHAPRPPPELRHYEPSYGTDYVPPRRHDIDDRRGGLRNGSYDDRSKPPLHDDKRPSYDDRRPPPSAAADDRRPTMDDRPIRPLPGSDTRALPPSSEDRTRPSDEPVPVPRPASDDDRGTRSTSLAADERPRSNVSLEERLSQPLTTTPSLQERLSQPGPTAVPARVDAARAPSLEERLSLAPVAAAAAVPASGAATATSGRPFVRSASLSRDDLRAPPLKDDLRDRDRVSDFRPSTDFSRERPGEPPFPTSSSYRPDPDRSFGDRDDRDRRDRNVLGVDAPPRFGDSFSRVGPPPRRFSPPPVFDRDRDRDRGRSYLRPRSPPPPLFRTGESAYDPDGDRRYAIDRERERELFTQRERDWFGPGGDDDKRGPLPPPPPPSSWRPYDRPLFIDRDRFDRDRDFRDRDRERERERDRDRDRDMGGLYAARVHWDERDRRGFPPSPPPPPPSSRMDVNGGGPTRSLSSRLTDPYPPPPPLSVSAPMGGGGGGPGDDRSCVPPPLSRERDFDHRARYGGGGGGAAGPPPPLMADHPPFSRVRARSPSPPPRRGPLGSGIADDLRPPVKRAREDSGPGLGYASVGAAYASPRRGGGGGGGGGGEYTGGPPPTSATTTTTSVSGTGTGTGTMPARSTGTPPPSSTAGSSAFYDRDRDRERDRDRDRERERERERDYVRGPPGVGDYGVGYDRDRGGRRSPPMLMGGRMGGGGGVIGYGRGPIGGDRRDDRRYVPPPPRTS